MDEVDCGRAVLLVVVKVRRRKVGEGEVGVSLEGAVGAVLGLVHHLGDELGGEGDYEALQRREMGLGSVAW